MNNINSINSMNNNYLPVFKTKEVDNSVVTKPINSNVSMNGIEALSNYNLVHISPKRDFNISLVEPIQIPDDISQVEGEQIYNSEGELMEIVNEDKDFKYVYKPGSVPNQKYQLSVIDKKTNQIVKEQDEFNYTMYENSSINVTNFNNGIQTRTSYDSKTLMPIICEKIIDTNENEKIISYDFKYKEFSMYEYDKINNLEKISHYNSNGHLIERPTIENHIEEYASLEKPELYPKFELNDNPQLLEGEKKYYSNGMIEENIVNKNGEKIVYKFDTNGNIEEIQKKNLTINYFNDENHHPGYSIKEDFGNGKSKTSVYFNDGTSSCSICDNGKGEQYDFNKNGDIIRQLDYSYEELDNNLQNII